MRKALDAVVEGFLLVKENHQLGWWFQKALAMSRKNILL